MKKLMSKKGSQEIYITQREGCVVVRVFERRTRQTNTITVFDELLPGLISQLAAVAATQRKRKEKP